MNKNAISFSLPIPSCFVFILSLFVFSCKPTEKVHRAPLFDRSPHFLFEKLKSNEFHYEWLSAKYSAEVKTEGKSNSFKTTMRSRKDSVIWMSISPAFGIEVARIHITRDSIRFMNRLNTTYFEGDFKYLNKMFNTDLDFDVLQSILIGNAFSYFEEDDFKSFIDKDYYLLSTIRKRKLKRTIQKNDSLNLVVQSIWLEPKTYKIAKYNFRDFNIDRILDVNYSKFAAVDSQLFPFEMHFELKGEKPASININYSKVAHDTPQTLPFTIPAKYERIY